MKIKTEDFFWKLVLLFPITTLVQKYFGAINQLLFAAVFILLLYLVFRSGIIKIEAFVLICIMVVNHAYAFANTIFPVKNSNTLYYFAFWIMYYILITARLDELKEFIFKEEKYVCCIIRICCVI